MLTQAIILALLAALSPGGLLVLAVLLGAANPRTTALVYLAGAITMTVVLAAIVYVVLRADHISKPHQHATRYGLRLGLGILLLLAGIYMLRRGAKPPDPAKQNGGLVNRMIARPSWKTAFILGIIIYSPSLTFIAAIQEIATSTESTAAQVAAMALVIAITLALVWLPLLLYLFRPEQTGRVLRKFNGWLRRNGHQIVVVCLLGAGVLLTIDGLVGVA